jgi:hypothetical protein
MLKVSRQIGPADGVLGLGYNQLETSPFYGLTGKHQSKRVMLTVNPYQLFLSCQILGRAKSKLIERATFRFSDYWSSV